MYDGRSAKTIQAKQNNGNRAKMRHRNDAPNTITEMKSISSHPIFHSQILFILK